MVKIGLQIKANLENVDKLFTSHPNYSFRLKIKCLSCGEVSDKWQYISESETFPSRTARSDVNYLAKCKLCSRENTMDIIKDSNGIYSNNDQGKFKTLVIFDCRGLEPVEFAPTEGWIAIATESGNVFEDVDLTEKEWVDYDEKVNQSVGIYEVESQFCKIK